MWSGYQVGEPCVRRWRGRARGGCVPFGTGGGAGTATAGGAGGSDITGSGANGLAGALGLGGAGGGAEGPVGGGGGGGGYYGGGGGAGAILPPGASGGGGSSFLATSASGTSSPTPTTAAASVTITYTPAPAPQVTLSAQSLTFTRELLGGVAGQQTLKVGNNGSGPLTVGGIATGRADPGDFLIDDLCQQPVAPGASCDIGVRFAPLARGARTARLTILTNAPTAPAAVNLSGTGGLGTSAAGGSQGSSASSGQVVCQPGTAGAVGCEIECAPGTYKIRGTSERGTFSVLKAGVVVAHGALELTRDRVARHHLRLDPGSYTLIIRAGQRGRHGSCPPAIPRALGGDGSGWGRDPAAWPHPTSGGTSLTGPCMRQEVTFPLPVRKALLATPSTTRVSRQARLLRSSR
jgi:hypothetical protein